MKPDESAAQRLELLDLYRGFAVVAVLLYHYTAHLPDAYLRLSVRPLEVSWGFLGVQAFFAISGFCIFLTIERSRGCGEFFAKRIARLWPAFIACALITQVIIGWWGLSGREVSWLQWLGNIFLLNDLGIPFVDGAYWSLLVEVKYYLIFGLTYHLAKKRTFEYLAALFVITVAIAYSLPPEWRIVASLIKILFITEYLPWFMIGVGFYLLYSGRRSAGAVLVAALAVVLIIVLSGKTRLELLIALFVVLGGFALLLRFRHAPIPAWLRYIGVISFPLYLIHQFVGFVFIRELASIIPNTELRLLIVAMLVVLLAHLVHIAVEFRFRRKIELTLVRLISRTRLLLFVTWSWLAVR